MYRYNLSPTWVNFPILPVGVTVSTPEIPLTAISHNKPEIDPDLEHLDTFFFSMQNDERN